MWQSFLRRFSFDFRQPPIATAMRCIIIPPTSRRSEARHVIRESVPHNHPTGVPPEEATADRPYVKPAKRVKKALAVDENAPVEGTSETLVSCVLEMLFLCIVEPGRVTGPATCCLQRLGLAKIGTTHSLYGKLYNFDAILLLV